MSIEQLGDKLGVMPVTVRAHVNVLERDQLLRGVEHRTGRAGRPSRVYSLTEKAQELFPNSYDNLATHILDSVRELHGDESAARLIDKVGQDMADAHSDELENKPLSDKVETAAQILNDNGCLATWEKVDEKYVLTAHNCPYLHVVEHTPDICHMEVAFLEKALQTRVRLDDSLPAGSPHCTFVVEAQ